MDHSTQHPGFSSWRRTLLVIFLVAFLIRIVFILTLQDGFYFADGPIYSAAASHLVEHGEFPEGFDRAPLYPLFLAGVYGVAGEEAVIPRSLQAVLSACIAVVLAMIGKRAGGPGVGAIAGILWGIYPMGVAIAGVMYPTTLLTLLMACGVLCIMPGDHKESLARVALAGLLFGLAALAKPIVLVTIVFLAIWILFRERSGRVLLVSVFLFTTLATLAPWTIRNAYVHGRVVPIEARGLSGIKPIPKRLAGTIDIENDPLGHIAYIVRRYPREFVSFFQLHPGRTHFLRQELRDKVHEQDPSIVQHIGFGYNMIMAVSIASVGSIFAFALVGVCAMLKTADKRREFSLFVLLVMSFALGYAFSFGKVRYRVPVDPYIIIMSSWGLMYVWNRLVKRQRAPD